MTSSEHRPSATQRTLPGLAALLLCLLFVLIPSPAHAWDHPVTPQDWMTPATPMLSAEEVRKASGWKTLEGGLYSFGRHAGQVWFRATLDLPRCHSGECVLELPYPHLRDVNIFWHRNETLLLRQHGGYAIADNDLPCRGECFPVPAHDGPVTLSVGIVTDSPLLVPMHVYDEASLYRHTRTNHLLLGIFYGTFFVMCCYHAFLYASTRHREYLLYVGYIASMGLWCASHDGNLRDYLLVRDSWYASYHFHYALTLWTLVAGAAFGRRFLNTRSHLPVADRMLLVLMTAGLIGMAIILSVGEVAIPALVSLLTLLLAVTFIITAILELRRGVRMARYFLIGWITLALGSLWWVLTLNGILPYMQLSVYSVHLGAMLETVLLSLALGDRINSMERERTRLRRLAKNHLEEANRKLAASNRFKDEFLSNVTHELRTPMNGVLGSAELLQSTRLDSEQSDYLATLLQSGHLMLKVIDDLLTYTQLSAGRYSIRREPMTMAELFRSSLDQAADTCHQKRLRLNVHREASLPARLLGDAEKLELVMAHLLDNACKFTREGEISVSIAPCTSVPGKRHADCWLSLRVRDTGCGIDTALQKKIFEGFHQEDGSMSRRQGGLGIGLALCQQIVKLLGGTLELRSEKRLGTDVTVKIPLDRLSPESPA